MKRKLCNWGPGTRVLSFFLTFILTSNALFFNLVVLATDAHLSEMQVYDEHEVLEFVDEHGNSHATLEDALGAEVSGEMTEEMLEPEVDNEPTEEVVSNESSDDVFISEVVGIEPTTALVSGGSVLTGQTQVIDYAVIGNITVDGGILYLVNGGHITGTVTVVNGTFNMTGGIITGLGRGVDVTGVNSEFNMTGGTITGNSASSGAGVQVQHGASFNMSGSALIYNNTATTSGGGVTILSGSTFTMDGGEIRSNHADSASGGGGVRLNGSTFTMISGYIRNNTVSGAGGGVNLNDTDDAPHPSRFVMHGGVIEGNYSIGGAGGGGGGVRVWSGIFTMYDGIIRDNNTLFSLGGGGVSVRNTPFVMHGGSIYGNSSHDGNGGGVFLQTRDASFTVKSGSITNNFAALDGGGIWTRANDYNRTIAPEAYHNLNISPEVVFGGNRAGNGSYLPPTNWNITSIRGSGTSPEVLEHQIHQLNNYDVGYRFDPEASTARINRDDVDITIGQSEQLRSTIIEEHPLLNRFVMQSVTWSSSNTRVATVNHRGVITTRGVGTAIITSRTTLNNGRVIITNSTVRVNPIRVTRISLNVASINLTVNGTRLLASTVAPGNATDRHVTWSSNNTNVATVSQGGLVSARRAGTATITARTRDGNRVATATVTVGNIRVTGVTISGVAARTVNIGNHLNLVANVLPSTATNRGVTWSSSNNSIATVNSNGRVTGHRLGTVTITARTNDGGRTASVRVTVQGNTLSLSRYTWNPTRSASNVLINVTSNVRWTVTTSNANWLRVSNTSPVNRTGRGSFRINVIANTTTSQRTGTITVTAPGAPTRRVTVIQGALPMLTLSGNTWNPGPTASRVAVNVTSNVRWTVSRNVSWLGITNITPAHQTGNGSFILHATANTGNNPRMGTITITALGVPIRTIRVAQAPQPRLSLSGNVWNIDPTGSNTTVTVTSNVRWTVTSNVNWLMIPYLTAANRTGNGSFRIHAFPNPNFTPRVGTIMVTGIGVSPQRITVNQRGRSPIRVTGVSIAGATTRTLNIGNTLNLTATVTPSNATNQGVTWSSSNSNVASVNSNGRVTAHRVGTTTIVVQTNDGDRIASVRVTVTAPVVRVTGVMIESDAIRRIELGHQITLTATVSPSNATNREVRWSSNNSNIFSVDSNGRVQAHRIGSAIITVTTNDGNHQTSVIVTTLGSRAYGAPGRYFRPMDYGTHPPNCFGYVMMQNIYPSLLAPRANETAANRVIRSFNAHNFDARLIASATASIYPDEYRVAFRIDPQGRGWHVIYQLSNGNWASKNAHWNSLQASDSTHNSLWAYDRNCLPLFGCIIRSTFSGSNTYLAIRPQ